MMKLKFDFSHKVLRVGILILFTLVAVCTGTDTTSAAEEASPSVLYVPLIGVTSVPDPLALPQGSGKVTYKYAVKTFLEEIPLTEVKVVDDKCSPVTFTEGDDNANSRLDHDETWRYSCATTVTGTTKNTAIATGVFNGISASHKAYSAVIVGSDSPPPLISVVNVTKVAYPLKLPPEGGSITYTYKVNNPGETALSDVAIKDDNCTGMSGKLGDTNSNNLLDTNEVWIYNCTVNLKETTTNTVHVSAFANGLQASDDTSLTVKVENSPTVAPPIFPDTGRLPNVKMMVWTVLGAVLIVLLLIVVFVHPGYMKKPKSQPK